MQGWGYVDLGSLDTQAHLVLYCQSRSHFLSVSVRDPEVRTTLQIKRTIIWSMGLHYCWMILIEKHLR